MSHVLTHQLLRIMVTVPHIERKGLEIVHQKDVHLKRRQKRDENSREVHTSREWLKRMMLIVALKIIRARAKLPTRLQTFYKNLLDIFFLTFCKSEKKIYEWKKAYSSNRYEKALGVSQLVLLYFYVFSDMRGEQKIIIILNECWGSL